MPVRFALPIAAVGIGALAIAACSQVEPQTPGAAAPAVRVTGSTTSCIPLGQIRETRVRDDWTVDFMTTSGRGWRNTLSNRCNGLKAADAIAYETSLNQLCSTDIVYQLQQIGGRPQRGPACGLGQFVPMEIR